METLQIPAVLGEYQRITRELANSYRERGDLTALVIRIQAESWENTSTSPVTERRELSRHAGNGFASAIAKLDGEILAYEAELRSLDVMLRYQVMAGDGDGDGGME